MTMGSLIASRMCIIFIFFVCSSRRRHTRFAGDWSSDVCSSDLEVQVKTGGFEPQYGHASGGIVQIVTKSGGTKTHGEISGYAKARDMQDTPANADDFQLQNAFGRRLETVNYEADVELGGYVPLRGLRDRLFYFGNFNPSFNHQYVATVPGSGIAANYGSTQGVVDRITNS